MFGRKRKATTPSAPSHPDDNLRLKSSGERVTILSRMPDGDVKVAFVDKPYPSEGIASPDDLRPA